MTPFDDDFSAPVDLTIDGVDRRFDVDEPTLPDWVAEAKLSAGHYPYTEKYGRRRYTEDLHALHIELVKMHYWQKATGVRVVCVFEGRDSAGKGGSIKALSANLNPRTTRAVALAKPSDRERGQWYFQRYTAHLPTAGELVMFDRSWYNRAGVEPVMGFCTPDEHQRFLREAPDFEASLTRDGVVLIKFWLEIGRQTQLKRFHDRRHDRRKIWKLSPMDIEALSKWDAYSEARDEMLAATHTNHAPWTIVRMNDKRRGRINLIRHLLTQIPYQDRDETIVTAPDPAIVTDGESFLSS